MNRFIPSAIALGLASTSVVAQPIPQTCRLNSPLSVVVVSGVQSVTHTYNLALGANGTFTGTAADNTEIIAGSLVGNAFSMKSTYTNGATFTINGALHPATGRITGTGISSQNQQLGFTAVGATCTTMRENCPAAPAIANAHLHSLIQRRTPEQERNILAQVARETGPGSRFRGLAPCDDGYGVAVRAFVDERVRP